MRKIFIDGGANKGQSTENFISRFSEFKLEPENWEIYMIEPNSGCNGKIEKVINKYKNDDGFNITYYNKALWKNDDELTLKHNSGGDGCTESGSTVFKNGPKTQKVKSIHLSKWIKENFNKDDYIILKLDIEGAEYEIINDLYKTDTLSYINTIHGELHGIKKGYNINDDLILLEQLKKYDLKLWTWNGSNHTKPIYGSVYSWDKLESEYKKWETRNYSLEPDWDSLKHYQKNYKEWYDENME